MINEETTTEETTTEEIEESLDQCDVCADQGPEGTMLWVEYQGLVCSSCRKSR